MTPDEKRHIQHIFHRSKMTNELCCNYDYNGLSVTQAIKLIKQPDNGFFPVEDMQTQYFKDGKTLADYENISPVLVGLTVDYLTRLAVFNAPNKAFHISLLGAKCYDDYFETGDATEQLQELIDIIGSAEYIDTAITAAVQACVYDQFFREGIERKEIYKPVPNRDTIHNIATMVERGVTFLKEHASYNKIYDFDTFQGGYTEKISYGDCDYVTDAALVDFKVYRSNFTKNHTLQLLMYWRLGKHSIHKSAFNDIKSLVLFNPRRNLASFINTDDVPDDIIKIVDHDLIGYEECYEDDDWIKMLEEENAILEAAQDLFGAEEIMTKELTWEDIRLRRLQLQPHTIIVKSSPYYPDEETVLDTDIKTKEKTLDYSKEKRRQAMKDLGISDDAIEKELWSWKKIRKERKKRSK